MEGIHEAGTPSRRTMLALGAGLAVAASPRVDAAPASRSSPLADLDPIRTELVMNLVVTCSAFETMGPGKASKDGDRARVWPIVGGRFEGPRLSGRVVPGGADLPVTRPDGVTVVDAFYRLQEADGTTIIIHNTGLAQVDPASGRRYYRLVPTFTTVAGPHDWLNKSIFVATLIAGDRMPDAMRLAGPGQNDRLIQVHRLF